MTALRRHSWLLAIFVGFLFLYGAVQNIGYFDASDSFNRYQMMKALVTTGSPNWKTPDNPALRICLNTVGPALTALPFQAVGYLGHSFRLFHGQLDQILLRFTLLSTVFYTSLWMCLLAQMCVMLGYSKRRGLMISVVAGVATMIFPYSKSAQGENVVGLCLTAIVIFFILYSRTSKRRYPVYIGLLYGLLLTSKNELAAVFPLLLAGVMLCGAKPHNKIWSNWKPGVIFCLGIIPGVAIDLCYNYLRFGNPLTTGHLGDSHGSSLLKPFNHPFWSGLYLQTFSPGKGLFWYCPVLLASMPLLWIFLRNQRRLLLLPYLWWAIMTCVYAKWYSPAGDTALGSRFQVSYLGFGVLPLLALPSRSTIASRLYSLWATVCVSASLCLQILFCLVSFNIDFHRKLNSVTGPIRQLNELHKMYYTFSDSLLAGFFTTFREGLLDMDFVRMRPLESALTILPGFWWILAASTAAFGIAIYLCLSPDKTARKLWRYRLSPQIPAMCFVLLGLFQAGSHGDHGLKFEIANQTGATHKTIVQDIAIENLNNGREVYKVASPFELRWSGHFYCPRPGVYSFFTESNRPLSITLARHEKTTTPGKEVTDITVQTKGWHSFELKCDHAFMYDQFIIKCKLPEDDDFQSLQELKLKH